jgi:MtN3 and saliva related transmembrane protein
MSSWVVILGLVAAALTTAANVPQLVKCWRTRETGDLSLVTLLALSTGLALWVLYGLLSRDAVIIAANAVALLIALALLVLKLRCDRPAFTHPTARRMADKGGGGR